LAHKITKYKSNVLQVVFGGVIVIALAIGPKVHRFKPGHEQRVFKGDKNPLYDFIRRGSKAIGLM
jgi:hypothetical protein